MEINIFPMRACGVNVFFPPPKHTDRINAPFERFLPPLQMKRIAFLVLLY